MTKKLQENNQTADILTELFNAGVHFGHKKSKGHPKMKPFIFSAKNGVQIINLQKTAEKLEEALLAVKEIISKNGTILFVGTKPAAKKIVEEAAIKVSMPYVTERWMGGILTNFKIISKRVAHMEELEKKRESGDFEKYTKKEKMLLEEELRKLQHKFNGLRNLKHLPNTLFIIDPVKENLAVREANKMNIPVIALTDIDADPTLITHFIPSNDDAVPAIKCIVDKVVQTIEEGKKFIKTKEAENEKTEEQK